MTASNVLSTRLLEGPQACLVIEEAELRVASGPDRGAKVDLGIDQLTIGSARSCGLVLHDDAVSARHAEIRSTTSGYQIRDLGSKNGIVAGSYRIDRAPLVDKMRLVLGESTLVVKALGKELTIALSQSGDYGDLVVRSVRMRALMAELEKLASSDVTVLIEGETGTGKEVVASALHRASPRRHGPFVTFDCSAATPTLTAAELFGHSRGAFTGADVPRPGLLEEAEGGTLFLDEIGEFALELQPLLLRLLEQRQTRRIGSNVDVSHNVRVIAATNRNLAEEVRAKRFRQDLYFRLHVGRIRVPPLRDRLEDVPALADTFAREVGSTIAPEQLAPLLSYDWPGNVRELRNVLTRMVVQRKNPRQAIDQERRRSPALYDEHGRLRSWPEARDLGAGTLEREYVAEVLALHTGNLSHAAVAAGISRQALTNLALKHGLHLRPRRARDPESDDP